MTPEELKEIEERYINLIKGGPISMEMVIELGRGISDIGKLLKYIKELEDQIPKWVHVIDNPPKENEEVLFGLFDPITQIFQGYMRNGHIFSDSHENSFLPVRGMYWQVLPGLPENIYKDLEG